MGIVATVGGVQFIRGIRDFSRVLYETTLLSAAVVGAYRAMALVCGATDLSAAAAYAGSFVLFAALALFLALLLNRVVAFDAGIFNYFFALLFAVGCGWAVGHAVLRSLYLAFTLSKPDIIMAIRRSWMASQLLYFGALIELLAILRFARYSNVPE